ncbi:hypothetical protein LTR53_000801 [Teratosphaeriaceae sp. CCFEE 6253]|nr:hypothetical protein LTR53_000801 [Teratosphaeriaceae sp. CCFEE 6253]
MDYSEKPRPVKPRIIIHGGAGNITRHNLPQEVYETYRDALLHVLHCANERLAIPGAAALDVATYAVTQLENNPLFNAGRGAVFTRAETHELEASVMVSKGYRKRGVGVMKVTCAKNPILLAKAMLEKGEADDGGGAAGHVQLEGATCDRLAREWGLECVERSYFWTRRRWEEHRRGLGRADDRETYVEHRRNADGGDQKVGRDAWPSLGSDPSWDGTEYLPQGTVGCVVLDSTGAICVATSTGGLTNKLPGRIGDTPTLGAGFWAEEWLTQTHALQHTPHLSPLSWPAILTSCLPALSGYLPLSSTADADDRPTGDLTPRAVAMSGTGNGDSFLRLAAVRTAAAQARFASFTPSRSLPTPTSWPSGGMYPLQDAVTAMAGPHGALQQSAGERWLESGEGEGGIIGIEMTGGVGRVVADFNCGGMFRTWVDDQGRSRMAVFREEGR